MKGPLWESIAAIFVKFQMDVPPTVEHLIERIETAFHRWSELKEYKQLLRTAEETTDGLGVDLAASSNDIQALQDEANKQNTD